jgi:hypothetical protein
MSLEYAVAQIMARLVDWAGAPKYQLERRVDIFLTPFLEMYLSRELKAPARLVAPEFPILSDLRAAGFAADRRTLSARTVNVDYLLWVEAPEPYWLMLELKTEQGSFEPEQAELYAVARERGMVSLIADIGMVQEKTEARHEWKYRRLLSRLPDAKVATNRIAVGYLGPAAMAEEVVRQVLPLEKCDRSIAREKPPAAVDLYLALQDFAGLSMEEVSADVRPLWPHVRDLLLAIDTASRVRPPRTIAP